jgi:hypothetical protein
MPHEELLENHLLAIQSNLKGVGALVEGVSALLLRGKGVASETSREYGMCGITDE